jgi:hypothetical protein
MQIIPHFDQSVDDSGYGAQIRADVNYVCNLYGGLFTNPVTLNIEISVGNPADGRASNHVGQNYNFDYATIKSHLSANLPDQDPLNGGGNNANYQLSSAQVQALGIPVSEYPAIDDYITVGSLASQSFTIGDNSPDSFVGAADGLPAVDAACAEAIAHGVHSADVVLNILARQRDPDPAANILTPAALTLHHPPVADCARYDNLRRTS